MTAQLDMFATLAAATPPPPAGERRTIAVPSAIYDGALADSYSACTIAGMGSVTDPFRHEGGLYAVTGRRWAGEERGGDQSEAYRLLALDAPAADYNRWDWDTMRSHPLGGYHGMAVTWAGKPMQLVGPPVVFVRADRQLPRTGAELLAQAVYACKWCDASGPASEAHTVDGWACCASCAAEPA